MDATLKDTRSHWITVNHNGIDREEVYPILTLTARGAERTVDVEANRYRHSSGMSEWRILTRNVEPGEGIGDATRAEIRAAVTPIVEAWLASDAYRQSRADALAHTIAREIADTNYTSGSYRAGDMLKRFGDELPDADRKRLAKALRLRIESLELIGR